MTIKYFVSVFNWCSLKCFSAKLTKLLVRCLNAPWKSFYVIKLTVLKAYPKPRCYSTLIGWCLRMHPIKVEQTTWLLLLGTRNPGRGCWSPRKLHFSKIDRRLALGFRLNATRKSINLSVYLVFDLETGRFKFLGENLLGAGGVFPPLTPSHNV